MSVSLREGNAGPAVRTIKSHTLPRLSELCFFFEVDADIKRSFNYCCYSLEVAKEDLVVRERVGPI